MSTCEALLIHIYWSLCTYLLRLNEKNEKTGNLTLTLEKFTKEDKSNFSRFAENMNSFVSEGQSHLVIILNST